jgi:hypothetical protein
MSFAGTRHQAQTSNENIANDERFMGFSISNHRQRGWTKAYSEADFKRISRAGACCREGAGVTLLKNGGSYGGQSDVGRQVGSALGTPAAI